MSTTADPVIFVVPGDLHLTEAGLDNHRVALRMVADVNDLIQPDFVQFIGDNVQDATEAQFRLFDDWRAIVQTHPIQAIVCGHTHNAQVGNDGRNVVLATRSIGDPEGGPPDYTIGYLDGEDGPVVLITHPRALLLATGPRHVVAGADHLRVRTWSAATVHEVRARFDDGAWFPLEPHGPSDWTAPLPGHHLAKGEHTSEVEAQATNGRNTSQRIDFPVDPTGRDTAAPTVHPPVRRTAFC